MRLVKLVVRQFQCIETADIELGPCLNVLHGPNDLGKTSLAWAIRAVLLLQHGSSLASRFASWYGDREPRVQLTFCDDTGRYWRVTKAFASGSAGRSQLESSKDGITFTDEVRGREVDKRVRELLGWGLVAPGGQGRQSFPESFLTQVLLADQAEDSVRDILLEPKLEKDGDESGRQRLVAALGALAQDPLFKQILDQTTERVDEAFTARGRRKTGAGSPWVQASERIAALTQEKESLERLARESQSVEGRIKELHAARDRVQHDVGELEKHLTATRDQLAAKRERDSLQQQADAHRLKLRDVEAGAREIESQAERVESLARVVTAAAEREEKARTDLTASEASLRQCREQLDALSLGGEETSTKESELQRELELTEQRVRDAMQACEAARARLDAASSAVRELDQQRTTCRAREVEARDAEAATSRQTIELDRVERALEAAREQQRHARSNDQAQTRELRRQELENKLLALAARRAQTESTIARARQAGEQRAALDQAEAVARKDTSALESAHAAVRADEATADQLDLARRGLVQLQAYGRVQGLRARLASGLQARAAIERERQLAHELRQQAEALEAGVRSGLPSAEAITTTRALRDDLRVAEAALGGGLSLAIRPKRPVAVRASRDGADPTDVIGDTPLTVSAKRHLSLAIDDLVELDITAGEEAARARAAELRARWLREGEAMLREHAVSSIEELDALRASSDNAIQRAAVLRNDAEQAEQRAMHAAADVVDAVRDELASAEAELGDADQEALATKVTRMGDAWQNSLRQRAAEIDAELETRRKQLSMKRENLVRLESQVQSRHAELQRMRGALADALAQLGADWDVVLATSRSALETIAAEEAEVTAAVAGLAEGASQAEAAAEVALRGAQESLEIARREHARVQQAAQVTRDAHVIARTRFDAATAVARRLDTHGAWTSLLDAGDVALPLTAWEHDVRSSEADLAQARGAVETVRSALAALRAARDAAVRTARERTERAERDVTEAREAAERAAIEHRNSVAAHRDAVIRHSELRVLVASVDVESIRREITALQARINNLEPQIGAVTEDRVSQLENDLERKRLQLRDDENELAKAKGALEQVGGAVIRERLVEIEHALRRAVAREHEVEVQYEAWRLLQTTLRECETSETAHLGRALAGPVSKRFRDLTGGRYGQLDLGAHLDAEGIHVGGERREIRALSAGTQDQLATLFRVCIAQQLRSAIVLDDHLSQSDVTRIGWFNGMLREAAAKVQIVLLTCRPQELILESERAADGEAVHDTGSVRVIDLSRVIKRYESRQSRSAVQ